MNKRLLVFVLITVALGAGLWAVLQRRPADHAGHAAVKEVYQCSMHPQIVSDRPGNCPICGMRLTKVVQSSAPVQPALQDGAAADRAAFTLSPERQQLIGVKTARAERRALTLDIRAAGRVAFDPELYTAIAEYREAVAARRRLSAESSPEARARVESLVEALSLRLRLLGVTPASLSTAAGDADAARLLLPGKNVWVYAQIYDDEAASVRAGQAAVVTAGGRSYDGKVASVDPVVDPVSRTLRARIKVETPGEALRPESFVHVTIRAPLGDALAVPREALLDTGAQQLVFVRSAEGRFEPRPVSVGREAQGQVEILDGLAEGEEIVTSANFLIDSESRFRAAVASFGGEKAAAPGHEGHAP